MGGSLKKLWARAGQSGALEDNKAISPRDRPRRERFENGWRERPASCVRQRICFERATAFSLPLLLKKGGEGRGEEALFINFPSLRLSPRSCLAGRER